MQRTPLSQRPHPALAVAQRLLVGNLAPDAWRFFQPDGTTFEVE